MLTRRASGEVDAGQIHKPRQLHKRDCKPDAGSLKNGFYIRNASESIGSVNLKPGVVIAELTGPG
ncbi:hypothetical protein [Paenibacillus sp. 22594]|uniref:hypothetical protein n=1 Tax=Paenibacillus sp. 22594 TaxID=3453947 RepID=UPI003F837EAF